MGCAGRVANGINTVHLSYVREKTGHALIGARQWIPEEQVKDPVKSLVTGVLIGGFINGQDPEDPPTEQRTRWFNRILNIVHAHAPAAKIILVRNPADALPAIGRVLGDSAPEPRQ